MSGARGPLSQSNVIRIRRGKPGHRKTPATTSQQFVSAVPNPPTTLSAEAKAEWKRIMPELSRTKVVAMGDRGILTTYCWTWAAIHDLEKAKQKALKAIEELDDPPAVLGAIDKLLKIEGTINAKLRLLLPMQQQLLLTPVSRLRTPPPKQEDDNLEDLD